MATFPALAHVRPLAATMTQARMERYDLIILHTMVGFLASTEAMFKKDGYKGVESHFGVGGAHGSDLQNNLDGVAYQWVDTRNRADANLDANPRAISIETGDNAPKSASDIAPWSPKQCEKLAQLIAALCTEHNIPCRLVSNSKSTSRGIAYHRQGISPWRVSGGEVWSNANGKECPGDRRIVQIPGIIARANEIIQEEEDDMAAPTIGEIRAVIRDELDRPETIKAIVAELAKPENAKALAEALFTADVINAPDSAVADNPANPTWRTDSFLREIYENTRPPESPTGK